MATQRIILLLLLAVATVSGPGVKQRIERAAASACDVTKPVDSSVCRAVRAGGVKQRIAAASAEPTCAASSSGTNENTEFRADLKHYWARGKADFRGWDQPCGHIRPLRAL